MTDAAPARRSPTRTSPMPTDDGRIRILEFIRPTTGGAARHVELLIRMIDRERFDVTVATHAAPDGDQFIARVRSLGVHVETLNIRRSFRPLADLAALRRVHRLVENGRFDLIHCHAAKAGLLGRLAGRLAGCRRVLYTPHGFYFNYGLTVLKRKTHIWLERRLGRMTHRIVATAPREGAQIVELDLIAPERVNIIPNAVDTESFRPKGAPPTDRRRGPVIGMVGRLAPPKDPFTFLRAARLVLEPFPDSRFVLVGDGELMKRAERCANDLGIAGSVDFLGYREDIQSVISTFDINVLSSNWEGLPYALVEGMALGKVAVGPDISGCSDLIRDGHNGFLFPLRDHETLARHIARLLRDDDLRERMGAAARTFVEERHSADLWIKRIEGLYLSSVDPETAAGAVARAACEREAPGSGPPGAQTATAR